MYDWEKYQAEEDRLDYVAGKNHIHERYRKAVTMDTRSRDVDDPVFRAAFAADTYGDDDVADKKED